MDTLLGRLAAGEDLSQDEATTLFEAVMQGELPDGQVGLLLTLLREKGETVAEIAGAAAALRHHMTPIRTDRGDLIDTCGTGGDGSGTFNISTAAAIVTAAAGVPVAKHGNRRITSRTGSADVLLALGVNIEADVPRVESCLDELGICFCFAPLLHGAMKRVAAVRRKLGVPTIFNMLGPLTNPAGAKYQLLGVGRSELRPKLAEALALLGTVRAAVVCGEDGLDEVTLAGPTVVSGIGWESSHSGNLDEFRWTPEEFGLEPSSLKTIEVDGPEQSAAMIRAVLSGELGAARDIVVLNAAAALLTAGKTDSPLKATARTAEAIDSGAASGLLNRLVEVTQE